jgi:carboxymethylenebutenolidase
MTIPVRRQFSRRNVTAAVAIAAAFLSAPARAQDTVPERVSFASADRATTLTGYLFKPANPTSSRIPAVVMMHGRAGAYSERANGVFDATTLSMRHKAWGREWADAGYLALLVDGFGPRGYPQGFSRFSYDSRPDVLNEMTVRPLDAYGALTYLRSRADVIADRIGLQGWSNGGSATIATMSLDAPGIAQPSPKTGFRAALAFYPGCGLKGHFDQQPFRPYAPLLLLHGTADEEVSYKRCVSLAERSREAGGQVELKVYAGATHSFDSPARSRQSNDANAMATEDAVERALQFFARYVSGGARD